MRPVGCKKIYIYCTLEFYIYSRTERIDSGVESGNALSWRLGAKSYQAKCRPKKPTWCMCRRPIQETAIPGSVPPDRIT